MKGYIAKDGTTNCPLEGALAPASGGVKPTLHEAATQATAPNPTGSYTSKKLRQHVGCGVTPSVAQSAPPPSREGLFAPWIYRPSSMVCRQQDIVKRSTQHVQRIASIRLRHVSHRGREKIACDLPGLSADGLHRFPQERACAVGVACYPEGIGERMYNLIVCKQHLATVTGTLHRKQTPEKHPRPVCVPVDLFLSTQHPADRKRAAIDEHH